MEGKLRTTQALLDEEVRRSAGLSETLGLRGKAHSVKVRKYVVELKKLKEDLALTVPRSRESEAFQKDVEDYVALHMEDLVTRWFAIEAGRERIAAEGLLMYDVGQYAMQRDIYIAFGRRDATFDPLAWGLPAKLANPDPVASAESAEPVGVVADLHPSLP
nr:tubby-related protein 1-like isoform X2 [Ipomoea batatas]